MSAVEIWQDFGDDDLWHATTGPSRWDLSATGSSAAAAVAALEAKVAARADVPDTVLDDLRGGWLPGTPEDRRPHRRAS